CLRTPVLTKPHRLHASPAWHTPPASPQPSRPPTPSWLPLQPLPGALQPKPAATHPAQPTPIRGVAHAPSQAPTRASWLRAPAYGLRRASHVEALAPVPRSIAANHPPIQPWRRGQTVAACIGGFGSGCWGNALAPRY